MAVHDEQSQRLFIDAPLVAGAAIECTREQANYLVNVLRLKPGDAILVFNGRDGEWRAHVAVAKKKSCVLALTRAVRAQEDGPDIDYLFAPLKRARFDYMVQKATELGVRRLSPVITRRTIAERVNLERMRANAIEAAEQCGILRVPEVVEPQKLGDALTGWDARRRLIVCDESAEVASPIDALRAAFAGSGGTAQPPPVGLLVGPEGGFDPAERELLLATPFVTAISLGPRVMRADTAAVAALALVNAVVGDWR
jgi:16S rRNA (uracil1498-N3)-methyltransferase